MLEKDHVAEVFEYSSYIRGYHAYLDIWTPVTGEVLPCFREPSNTEDSEAVAVTRRDYKSCVLGHLPRYFCKWVSRFLKKSTNKAMAEIMGTKVNRGAGLGLEVPCTYKFHGDNDSIEWLKKKIEFEKDILKNLYKRD